MINRFLLVFLVCGAALCPSEASAEEPTSREGNTRIVFIGDSITGQGGGWLGTGYVFKIREALTAAHPGAKPDLVPLGGSGMGVGAWLGLAKDESKQKRDLDVKGVEVGTALSQPADVMVVMLGMNYVLAPYVNESDESLDQWLAHYRELVALLSARMHPKVIGFATITPQTEDPETPKNRVMARMNQRITAFAAEIKARVLPTNRTYWEILAEGRQKQADFTLACDRIHPNAAGHVAVAIGMLRGLGEEKAADWLRQERLAKTISEPKPVAPLAPPPPWLVAGGLVLRGWQDRPAAADLAANPIDLAIEHGEVFWKKPARTDGPPLTWRPFQSSINLTDGANPGSVDFAGITFGQNFEAGYGARWIHAETARHLRINLKASGVGSVIHLTVWLNGQRLYSDVITSEPKRQASREVDMREGWNALVFKSCHRNWQWQQSVTLTELDGSSPEGLGYRIEAPR